MKDNSEKNGVLASWKPGESGNPKGRPKGSVSLVAAIKRVLAENSPDDLSGRRKRIDDLALAIVQQASNGNKQAIQEIFQRLDGIVQPPSDQEEQPQILRELIMAMTYHAGSIVKKESVEEDEEYEEL